MLFIGIDLGTSAVKLLLMDEHGGIRNIVSKEYPLFFPEPGWSEQHPEDWMKAILEGIPELLAGEDSSQVAGIGTGGQMHGLVVLDKEDHVLRPAILWNDGRSQEETEYLNQVIGKEKISSYTGNIAFAGFTAPKLLWMKKHAPEGARVLHEILKKTKDQTFKTIAENVAHYHHERWDGKGYPNGLISEEIPILSRVIAIVDAYDAMSMIEVTGKHCLLKKHKGRYGIMPVHSLTR